MAGWDEEGKVLGKFSSFLAFLFFPHFFLVRIFSNEVVVFVAASIFLPKTKLRLKDCIEDKALLLPTRAY